MLFLERGMYQDALDPSRFLVPLVSLKLEGKETYTTVKVYWKTSKGLVYGGKTQILERLMDQNNRETPRIGFVRVS